MYRDPISAPHDAAAGTAHRGIGAALRRNEDARFLRGRGQYLGDLSFPGMREVAFLRSPVAHARVGAIDIPPEHRAAVFAAADLADMRPIVARSSAPGYRVSNHHPLATDKVRFVGEPVAMCVAPTRAQAEDLAQQIMVEFEELPPVVDMNRALDDDAPRVHEDWPDNLALESFIRQGDLEQARQQAAVSVTRAYRLNRHASVPMEGRGVLAYFDSRLDELVVYTSTQFPHVVRTMLAECLGIAERRLRVVAPDVGGGFGVKSNLHPEELCVAALALKLGHPVRWQEDRREHLLASQHAREHEYRITAHAAADGRLLALEAEVRVDAGAYSVWPWTSTMEAGMAAGMIPGPYDVPVYHARVMTIASNKSPLGPYRGVGRTGACLAIERTIDELARALGREPHDLRMQNAIRSAQMPYRSVSGKLYDSGDYAECVRLAAEAIGVDAIRQRQGADGGDGRRIGVGFASYTEQTAHGTEEWVARGLPVNFGFETATARLMPDGDLVLEVGIQNHGQGLETTLAQIAAEELGVDPARVVVRHGDSALSPFGMGTLASRSMVMAGGAVARACGLLKTRIARIGAHMLQVPESEVTVRDAAVCTPDRRIPFAAVARASSVHPEQLPAGEEPVLHVTATYQPSASTGAFSYGTHAAQVAVDVERGMVELLDYVVVHDCGTVVNPMIVEGQLVGGVAQGIGTALYEEIPYDDQGQPLASTFMDYLLPGPTEMPPIRLLHMNTPSPHTAYGIKGMGEGGAIAPPAAILNAITDALRSLGVEINETPATPRRVREAIRQAQGAR